TGALPGPTSTWHWIGAGPSLSGGSVAYPACKESCEHKRLPDPSSCGWPGPVGGGGAPSRLAGRASVVEALGSRHTRRFAYLSTGEALAAAALPRPRRGDQLELDAFITR